MVKSIKDSELPILKDKIYHLRLKPEQLARNIFVVGDPARADKVATYFDNIEYKIKNREFTTRTGKYRGMPVSVIGTGIGTDNNEIALVEAFGLNEFDLESRVRKEKIQPLTIIRLGTSGGLQKDIEVGTLAISSYGLGLDNTGLFYDQEAPDEISLRIEKEAYKIITNAAPKESRFKGKIYPYVSKASPEIVKSLAKNAKENYVIGITASASGFFAPQGREIDGLKITIPRLQEHLADLEVDGQKVVNFEMESSLLFHLARQMNYKAGTICPILANRPKGTFLKDYEAVVEKCIKVGLKAMLELYKKIK